MAIVNGYATLAEIKARLAISGSAKDGALERTVEAASRQIDGITGRHFYPDAAATRTFTAEEGDWIPLDDLVIVTTLATDDDGDRVYETTWAATDYDLSPDNAAGLGRPYTAIETAPNGRYRFPRHRKGVQITGTFGWPTVPSAVAEACLLIASRLTKRIDAPYGIAGSDALGQAQLIPANDPDVRALLAPYRRFAVLGV